MQSTNWPSCGFIERLVNCSWTSTPIFPKASTASRNPVRLNVDGRVRAEGALIISQSQHTRGRIEAPAFSHPHEHSDRRRYACERADARWNSLNVNARVRYLDRHLVPPLK